MPRPSSVSAGSTDPPPSGRRCVGRCLEPGDVGACASSRPGADEAFLHEVLRGGEVAREQVGVSHQRVTPLADEVLELPLPGHAVSSPSPRTRSCRPLRRPGPAGGWGSHPNGATGVGGSTACGRGGSSMTTRRPPEVRAPAAHLRWTASARWVVRPRSRGPHPPRRAGGPNRWVRARESPGRSSTGLRGHALSMPPRRRWHGRLARRTRRAARSCDAPVGLKARRPGCALTRRCRGPPPRRRPRRPPSGPPPPA